MSVTGRLGLPANDNEDDAGLADYRFNALVVAQFLAELDAAQSCPQRCAVCLAWSQRLVVRFPDKAKLAWLVSECLAALAAPDAAMQG